MAASSRALAATVRSAASPHSRSTVPTAGITLIRPGTGSNRVGWAGEPAASSGDAVMASTRAASSRSTGSPTSAVMSRAVISPIRVTTMASSLSSLATSSLAASASA